MALSNSKSQLLLFPNFLSLTIFLFLLFPSANSISFNFSSFQPNNQGIHYQGDAFPANGVIQLTGQQRDNIGRASFALPVPLWDKKTGNLTDFNTHFSFIIQPINPSTPVGDGLSFFLSPYNARIPEDSGGGCLGLMDYDTAFNHTNNNQIVAVEFDTYENLWDPSSQHVGIDVNGIKSVAYLTWDTSLANNRTANAWVNYDSATTTLSVYLTYEENPVFQGNYILSYVVDLREVLPEWVSVGFSAATGYNTEINKVVSWTFHSTLGG